VAASARGGESGVSEGDDALWCRRAAIINGDLPSFPVGLCSEGAVFADVNEGVFNARVL